MKRMIMAVALVCSLTGSGWAAGPAWKIEGKAITADSCTVGCPCVLGLPPARGKCEYVGILEIERGRYGSTRLDGMHIGIAGGFGRKENQGEPQHSFVAYYIDIRGSADQREALRKILTGPGFAELGQPAEIKEVPILTTNFKSHGQVGEVCSGTIGSFGVIHVVPISGAKTGQPLVVLNSAEPLWEWTAIGKAKGSFFKGAGRNFQFDGTSGESHRFTLSSDDK